MFSKTLESTEWIQHWFSKQLKCLFLLISVSLCMLVVISLFFIFLALPELTRKQVADMFYNAELEYELREPTKPHRMKWSFKADAQRDEYIKKITDEAASSVYHHQQADKCTEKGTNHIRDFHTVYRW